MPDVTTIKVSKELRDRLKRDAERDGVPIATLLAQLLSRYERDERLAAVGRAYARDTEGYVAETAEWDSTLGDGLAE